MFNRSHYENSSPDGFAMLEVAGDSGGPRRFVPLRRTSLRGEVVGPLAALRQSQVFGYSSAQCTETIEARFRFPLPGDAAVTGVTVRFGEVEIRAELAERERAERDYDDAVREGRPAALATREAPDVFSLNVAGIRPDQEVVIETAFVVLARADGPGWTLRIPLTTAPRYLRHDEVGTRAADAQPLALARDPGHRFELDLTIAGVVSARCPSHEIDRSPAPGGIRLRLRDGEVVPDRDLVLAWTPDRAGDRPTLAAWVFNDPGTDRAYFLALVAPPAAHDPGRGVPREAVVLVDRSGSMEGPKWEAADWAVERFVSDLGERDALGLGLFHSETRWWSRATREADRRAVADAVAFLRRHADSGGTELGVALEQALALDRAPGDRARHVLVITDAQIGDEARVLRLADAEADRPDRRRISVLCIDAAPNANLALELAERGGGVARFLTSDPSQGDVATALDELLADWSEPVLHGLRLEVDRPGAEAAGRRVAADRGDRGRSSIDLGDLPAGRCLWVVGRLTHEGGAPLAFRLVDARGRALATLDARTDADAPGRPAIKALFGARRVNELERLRSARYWHDRVPERLRRLGYDPDAVLASSGARDRVYAENRGTDWDEALRRLLVIESLDFGLASAEAAFVATRTEAGRLIDRSVAVPSALPSGWADPFGSSPHASACMPLRSMGQSRFLGDLASQSLARKVIPRRPSAAGRAHPGPFESPFIRPGGGPPPDPSAGLHHPDLSDSMLYKHLDDAEASYAGPAPEGLIFEGVPAFEGGEAILFDSDRPGAGGGPPEGATLTRLVVRLLGAGPGPGAVDPGLTLLLFVGDPTEPRARVRLARLVGNDFGRPLNLTRGPGQPVRLVLADPAGAWSSEAPRIAVVLLWA